MLMQDDVKLLLFLLWPRAKPRFDILRNLMPKQGLMKTNGDCWKVYFEIKFPWKDSEHIY